MRIGIFGGTFAPPHNTHIQIAVQAINQFGLDRLFVIPNGQPPHKRTLIDSTHRLNMTHLAFDGIDGVTVSDYELTQNGDSYTYLTLTHFEQMYKGAELFFIMGGDSLRDFEHWVHPQVIADKAALVVCQRGGIEYNTYMEQVQKHYGARIYTLNTNVNNVSSRSLRVALTYVEANALPSQNASDLSALPQSVMEYALTHHLFANNAKYVERLKNYITPIRFAHVYRTVQAGIALHSRVDENDVFIACLLHDCAKSMTAEDWPRYGYVNANNIPPKLVHSELGASVARQDYNITNPDILNAIFYHSTARANMSELEKIVYIADKIEQGRPYPTAHLLRPTLDGTFCAVLSEAAESTRSKGRELSPYTKQAIKYYLKKDIL